MRRTALFALMSLLAACGGGAGGGGPAAPAAPTITGLTLSGIADEAVSVEASLDDGSGPVSFADQDAEPGSWSVEIDLTAAGAVAELTISAEDAAGNPAALAGNLQR